MSWLTSNERGGFDDTFAMSDVECAKAYRELRREAAELGYPCVGHALDELKLFLTPSDRSDAR